MKGTAEKKVLEKFLKASDVEINGDRPWDLQVNNPGSFQRIASGGSLALGESYMEGWWDCEALDQFFEKIFENKLDQKLKKNPENHFGLHLLRPGKLFLQTNLKPMKSGNDIMTRGINFLL